MSLYLPTQLVPRLSAAIDHQTLSDHSFTASSSLRPLPAHPFSSLLLPPCRSPPSTYTPAPLHRIAHRLMQAAHSPPRPSSDSTSPPPTSLSAATARIAELEEHIRQLEAALASSSHSSSRPAQTFLRLGDVAPNFDAVTQHGAFNLYAHMADDWWLVLFSHPADFTPVCTTELARAAELEDQLTKRHVKIVALSVDSVEHHRQWVADIEDINKGVSLRYPIIADTDRKVATLYNMLQHDAPDAGQALPLTVRSVHIIGADHKIKAIIQYPASTGRSFDEILRAIDSLQLSEKYHIATPCEWKRGGSCMLLPSVKDSDAHALFPKGITIIRPWLRTTPFPE